MSKQCLPRPRRAMVSRGGRQSTSLAAIAHNNSSPTTSGLRGLLRSGSLLWAVTYSGRATPAEVFNSAKYSPSSGSDCSELITGRWGVRCPVVGRLGR